MKAIFSKQFYKRGDDESVLHFFMRTVPAMALMFVIFGIPILLVMALVKGRFEMNYIIRNGADAFIGAIVGAPISMLLRDYIRRWFAKTQSSNNVDDA